MPTAANMINGWAGAFTGPSVVNSILNRVPSATPATSTGLPTAPAGNPQATNPSAYFQNPVNNPGSLAHFNSLQNPQKVLTPTSSAETPAYFQNKKNDLNSFQNWLNIGGGLQAPEGKTNPLQSGWTIGGEKWLWG
jgi:hypothetical protein